MADHAQFDHRLESLVIERRTDYDADLAELTPDDRHWLAATLHAAPQRATHLHYERQHTGFAREITATRADVERLYRERVLKS